MTYDEIEERYHAAALAENESSWDEPAEDDEREAG